MFSAPYRYQSEGAVSGESHQVRPGFSSVTRTIGAPVSPVEEWRKMSSQHSDAVNI